MQGKGREVRELKRIQNVTMLGKYLTAATLSPWSRIFLQDQVAPPVFLQTFSELSFYPKFTSMLADLKV